VAPGRTIQAGTPFAYFRGAYGRLCGWALARPHARTGRATLISGYMGSAETFDHAVAEFAVAYAAQNERDYQLLVNAVASGRVHAMTGV
jgi:Uncharacterized protein conserved in bacteria (DUF2252)